MFIASDLSPYFYSTPSPFITPLSLYPAASFNYSSHVLSIIYHYPSTNVASSIQEQYASAYARKLHNYDQILQSRAGPLAETPSQTTFFIPNSSAIITAAFSPMTSAVE